MPAATTQLKQVSKNDLKITKGSVSETESGFLRITDPKVRAVEKSGNAQSGRLSFRYRGPTEQTAPLASGKVVRQIGLKLRAKNTCNLLYVMWELERMEGDRRDHRERLKILVKRNPGKEYHNSIPGIREGCGSEGYEPIDTVRLADLASAKDKRTHTMQADLNARGSNGYDLAIHVDDREVWRGTIPHALLHDIDGPAGLRTDNGSFIFRFYTGRERVVRDHRD